MNRTHLLIAGALILGLVVMGRRSDARNPAGASAYRGGLRMNAGAGACDTVRGASVRVQRTSAPAVLSELEQAAMMHALEDDRLAELVELHVAKEPTAGKFYQVGPDDTPETIARAVLAPFGKFTVAQVRDYIYCFTSSPYNLDRYGTRSTTKRYPKRWLIPGFGQGLRGAFLPRNVDGLAALRSGRFPMRTIDPRSAKYIDHGLPTHPTAYGLIWLPPISPEQLEIGVVTCAPFTWDDGSSSINPDPELLDLLQEAA